MSAGEVQEGEKEQVPTLVTEENKDEFTTSDPVSRIKWLPVNSQENLSSFVQGTAENLLSKFEDSLLVERTPFVAGDDESATEEEHLQDSLPAPLGEDSKEVEDVLNIISQSIYREGEGQVLLKLGDKSSLLSVVSHSLAAYITTLDPVPLQKLSARIAAEVSLWICDLFKFSDGATYCHDDTREGLVKIARMALHKQFPKMSNDGFEALFSRPPVIYLTSNTYLEIAHYVCLQLGLPISTVRVLSTSIGEDDVKGETTTLKMEDVFMEDKAAGRMPTLCVANVHSSLFQGMNATMFEEICRKHGVWLHLEGHALAGLALMKRLNDWPSTGDSLSLTLGSWLGIPALPFVTVYKSSEAAAVQSAGLSIVNPAVRLNCLPLWCVLKSLGTRQIHQRISNVFELIEILNSKLSEISSMRILSQRPEQDNVFVRVGDLTEGKFNLAHIFRTISPALAFQYVSPHPPYEENDAIQKMPVYFNNLNSWLGQTMQRGCPQIPLEIVDVEATGYVLRLCPFESLAFSGGVCLTEEDIEHFIEGLEAQIAILDATVCQRKKFHELIERENRLEYVEIPNWAGLGGVSYLPPDFRPSEADQEASNENEAEKNPRLFTPAEMAVINQRNVELVARLRSMDSAFSIGKSGCGDRVCIRFGMVSMETDVGELLTLVLKTAEQLDKQMIQLTQMSELVRKSIEQAAEDLKKESDEAIWQEGVLRHVPLVGSFYNWLSPLQKPQIKGRCLSLKEGKLESTESVYKLHGMLDEEKNAVEESILDPVDSNSPLQDQEEPNSRRTPEMKTAVPQGEEVEASA